MCPSLLQVVWDRCLCTLSHVLAVQSKSAFPRFKLARTQSTAIRDLLWKTGEGSWKSLRIKVSKYMLVECRLASVGLSGWAGRIINPLLCAPLRCSIVDTLGKICIPRRETGKQTSSAQFICSLKDKTLTILDGQGRPPIKVLDNALPTVGCQLPRHPGQPILDH